MQDLLSGLVSAPAFSVSVFTPATPTLLQSGLELSPVSSEDRNHLMAFPSSVSSLCAPVSHFP